MITSVCFHSDRLIRRKLLKVEFLACDQVLLLISILLELSFKLVSFDTGLVTVLADVLNMLESFLTQELLLQSVNDVLAPLYLLLLHVNTALH